MTKIYNDIYSLIRPQWVNVDPAHLHMHLQVSTHSTARRNFGSRASENLRIYRALMSRHHLVFQGQLNCVFSSNMKDMIWHLFQCFPAGSILTGIILKHFTYMYIACNRVCVFLVAITGTTILVPYHAAKSLQLIWGSGTRRFHLRVPNLQMSCSDLTTW